MWTPKRTRFARRWCRPKGGCGPNCEPWQIQKLGAPMKYDVPLQAAEDDRPRCCVVCGTPYADGNDELGCPVCLIRRVLEPASEGHPGIWGDGPSRPDDGHFDHYEIARCDDGAFDELGRGAMGVTYK